jgi:CheY-like chemotaxis protein
MQVLVVEDDVILADCLVEALLDAGHVVCGIASTVAEAVALARENHPDVAICDMHLRGGERGTDIADRLTEAGELGQMGILYVTGEAERVLQEARFGHACLSKPYTLFALNVALQVVREMARDGRSSHPLPRGLRLLDPTTMRRESTA